MSSAINKVKEFLGDNHQATTTEVETETAAPVVQETVQGHEHVETATAVDREKHIHHHQHRVQPVVAEEHLAEQHETRVAPEETRERIETISPEKEALLAEQRGQYQDSQTIGATTRTGENLGTTESEHVHHHVHETVTPVIQKDTHEHKVIHDVNLIHEKVHEAPIVHETTTLPPVSIDEFKAQTGDVSNHGASTHQHAFYEGKPKVDSI